MVFYKKLNIYFGKYRILKAGNSPFALRTITLKDRTGTMFPGNVMIHENGNEIIEMFMNNSLQYITVAKIKK
ncbi:MAG: DUF302 domain-containing protein [Calditrichaceae bacterium]|nr:DUF302 domain-containing protein [Calditrichaceae bacterium]MBN2707424.1 DUF302 domain-containing protein [Calditrichaceae bacterium]